MGKGLFEMQKVKKLKFFLKNKKIDRKSKIIKLLSHIKNINLI